MTTKKLAVAFLDILSFKNHMENLGVEGLGTKYHSAIQMAFNHLAIKTSEKFDQSYGNNPQAIGTPGLRQKIFSDSIILFSLDDTEDSVFRLLVGAWRYYQGFLALGFALRGGIAFGNMYVDYGNDIFLGDALTTAYQLENKQQWSGIALDPSIQENMPSHSHLFDGTSLFPTWEVPLKDGNFELLNVINWRYQLVLEKGTKAYFPYPKDQDKNADLKIANTLKFAKSMRKSGCYYNGPPEKLPVEFSTFWVGSQQPPFDHGDDY